MSQRRPGGDSSVGYDESWYYASAKGLTRYPTLAESLTADVCVIGAGYTGLSAALELAERGYRVVVLEAHRVGSGASGRNGGVLGMGQRKDQDELEDWLGLDAAKQMWQIACDANQLVRSRVAKYAIDCDLSDGELTVAHKARYEQELWDYADKLEADYGYTDHRHVMREEAEAMLGVPSFFGGYLDHQAGHVHPLNLALGLARAAKELGVEIYEQTSVREFHDDGKKVRAHTDGAIVTADFLVLACNGYLGDLDKTAQKYQLPINNFILATEPLPESRARSINRDNVAVVDTRFVVNYFHNSPDNRLIFGGGENYSSRFPNDLKQFVRKNMLEVYPNLDDVAIDYAWGGTLAVTMKRMPHFGRKSPRVYWAQGYSGHGIAMANMGGQLVAEAIAGQAERFDLFANLNHQAFPGGTLLRWPALVAGMLFYKMLDRF